MKPEGPFVITGYYGDDPYGREVEIEENDFNTAMSKAGIICEEGGYASVTDANGEWYDP